MSHFRIGVLSVLFAGFLSFEGQAAEIQWATGCTSIGRPDVLSVSYDTASEQITLYHAHPSEQLNNVDRFTANYKSLRSFEPMTFSGYVNGARSEIQVEFQTKATMYLFEGADRIQYYCNFYSFDRDIR